MTDSTLDSNRLITSKLLDDSTLATTSEMSVVVARLAETLDPERTKRLANEGVTSCVVVNETDLRALLDAYANAHMEETDAWLECIMGRFPETHPEMPGATVDEFTCDTTKALSERWIYILRRYHDQIVTRLERRASKWRALARARREQVLAQQRHLNDAIESILSLENELAAANEQVWKMEDAWTRSTKAFEATILVLKAALEAKP